MAMRPFLLMPLLLAPLLAQGKPDGLEASIQSALQRARPVLLDFLDGAAPLMQGELALICLAALHDGVPNTDPHYLAARRRLGYANLQQTYELGLRLMVMEADPTFPEREKAAKHDAALLVQNAHAGGFDYGPKSPRWDLSNSQYGALGLRAAEALGVEVPAKVWRKLGDEVLDAQLADGGFDYQKGQRAGSYLSMTVAGIAVLCICEAQLTAGKGRITAYDRGVERAWKWLDKHQREVGDPGITWSFYAHYGLERAAILSDVTKLGQLDWYRAGAKMFVDLQLGNGGWHSQTDRGGVARHVGGDPVATAFAVLFLRRKFQKTLTAITVRVPSLKQIDDKTSEADLLACVGFLVQRGKPALAEVVPVLRSEVPAQRRAAVLALQQLAGQDFGIDPRRDAEQNRDALRAAELWYLKNR